MSQQYPQGPFPPQPPASQQAPQPAMPVAPMVPGIPSQFGVPTQTPFPGGPPQTPTPSPSYNAGTVIDFAKLVQEAKTASFAALPPNDYPVEVVEATTFTGSTQKPAIKTKMRVTDGPYVGKHVFNNFNVTLDNPNALSIFIRHMSIFGLPADWIASLPSGVGDAAFAPIAQALLGRRAVVTLGIRQWQGSDRNEVTAFKPAGAAMPGPGPAAPGPQPGFAPSPQAPSPAPTGFPGFTGAPPAPQPPAPAMMPVQAPPAPPSSLPPPTPAPTPPQPAAAPPASAPQQTPAAPPGWEIRDGQWVQVAQQAPAPPDGAQQAQQSAPQAPAQGGPPPLPF